ASISERPSSKSFCARRSGAGWAAAGAAFAAAPVTTHATRSLDHRRIPVLRTRSVPEDRFALPDLARDLADVPVAGGPVDAGRVDREGDRLEVLREGHGVTAAAAGQVQL